MSKNYREIYEQILGIKLQPGSSSIHHLNWNHGDNNTKNLVAIPQHLHDDLNLAFLKFPKIMKELSEYKCYWKIHYKKLEEIKKCIESYELLLKYIELRDMIKKYGLKKAEETFDKKLIEEVIILEKENNE